MPSEDDMPRKPATQRWLKMGVELEGAWRPSASERAAKCTGAQSKGDGSVSGLRGDQGEITTRPHTILEHLCKDVVTMYPDEVNHTCGFHIHASFTPLDYSALTNPKFYEFYRAKWREWGTANVALMGVNAESFWGRLDGRSNSRGRDYCKDQFIPDMQLSRSGGDRYTALNFTAWHSHKTLESRLLPMFASAECAVSAIAQLGAIYDEWLGEHGLEPIKMEQVIEETPDGAIVERFTFTEPDLEPWTYTARPVKVPRLVAGRDVYYRLPRAQEYMIFGDEKPDEKTEL